MIATENVCSQCGGKFMDMCEDGIPAKGMLCRECTQIKRRVLAEQREAAEREAKLNR